MSEKCILNFVEKISKYCMFLVLINVCKSFELLFCVLFLICATGFSSASVWLPRHFFSTNKDRYIKKNISLLCSSEHLSYTPKRDWSRSIIFCFILEVRNIFCIKVIKSQTFFHQDSINRDSELTLRYFELLTK